MSRLVALLPLVAMVATSALADVRAESGNRDRSAPSVGSFESLDRNADQRLSRSEAGFDRVLSIVFADTDTDGDGFVSKVEYAAIDKSRSIAAR